MPTRRERAEFVACARSYWLEIFTETRREKERWAARARTISNPILRRDALHTIEEKWGHSEGAAAFAVLVPREARGGFIRMAISFELMLDYLDTISERAVSDPWANTQRLHRAPRDAVTLMPGRDSDYYMFHAHRGDGGFLSSMITSCRGPLSTLPSHAVVAGQVEELVSLYGEAQSHCHAEEREAASSGPTRGIDATAARYPDLSWGDVAAGCTSSVAVLALMALAAEEHCSHEEVANCLAAYFPWVASLNILLHSLVDESADLDAGNFNQLSHYRSKQEAAEALAAIALQAKNHLARLPGAGTHLTLLGGMVGYYLAEPAAWEGENRLVSAAVLETVGSVARWSTLVHRLRRGRLGLARRNVPATETPASR
jgi:tetraprenyl-beta-curcumene synthase